MGSVNARLGTEAEPDMTIAGNSGDTITVRVVENSIRQVAAAKAVAFDEAPELQHTFLNGIDVPEVLAVERPEQVLADQMLQMQPQPA